MFPSATGCYAIPGRPAGARAGVQEARGLLDVAAARGQSLASGHPFNALLVARSSSSTVTVPLRSASYDGQASTGISPRLILTPISSSATVTLRSGPQAPTQSEAPRPVTVEPVCVGLCVGVNVTDAVGVAVAAVVVGVAVGLAVGAALPVAVWVAVVLATTLAVALATTLAVGLPVDVAVGAGLPVAVWDGVALGGTLPVGLAVGVPVGAVLPVAVCVGVVLAA